MTLPVISTPTYELVLPSNNKKIKYRPFLVREEKTLLLAMESEDLSLINGAVIDVLNNCILTKGVKVEELPIFDIEYFFLNLRGKSIGESIDLVITCGDDGQTEVPLTFYIDEIEVEKDENHSKDIQLSDTMMMRMKYPSFERFIKDNFNKDNKEDMLELSFKIIASCIEMVVDGDECWAASDYTEDDLLKFLEQLTPAQYRDIEQFFKTMPKLRYETIVINPVTGKENPVVLEGLSDFFV